MEYFVLGFYQFFVTRKEYVFSIQQNVFYFHSLTFVTYFYNKTFEIETRFKRLRSHVILMLHVVPKQ